MNIIQLIRLILKNIKLVLVVPIILSVLVAYLTRNTPKKFSSKTIIYTGIGTGYTIQSVNNSKFDFMKNKTAFDNLINIIESRKTFQEVGIRLLAKHLAIAEPYPTYISKAHYHELKNTFPDSLKKLLVVEGNYEKTYNNLMENANSSEFNYMYKLINNDHPYYSVKAISSISVMRISNSDLVEIKYSADDAGVCQQTLELLNEVFVKNYKEIKEGETNNVVAYFEHQLLLAKNKLDAVEKRLLNFNQNNNIINYYEQTKHISKYREDIDLLYQQEMMQAAAAKASIIKIEDQLNRRNKTLLKSASVIHKREKLSELTTHITILEVKDDNEEEKDDELLSLYAEAEKIKSELNTTLDEVGVVENTTAGLSQQDLMFKWLEQIIFYEESSARLKIYKDKIAELENVYKKYAPLGATMMRIERQIAVAEKEYLSILKGLNDSKIMQRNIQMSTNLNVMDKPFFPVIPEPSKRKLLIVAAGFVGFVLMVFIIIVLEYFDSSIKTHKHLEELSGLPTAGAFPNLYNNDKKLDFEYVVERTGNEIAQKIRMKAFGCDGNAVSKPYIVALFSTSLGDGKTTIGKFLHDMYKKDGFKVSYFNYLINNKPSKNDENLGVNYYNYEDLFNNEFDVKIFFENLIEDDYNEMDFVFLEIPSILHYPTPIRMLRNINFALFVARANRSWSVAESNVIDSFKETVLESTETESIANGVKVDVLETIIGEIPKKRSYIRRMVKRLIKFQVSSQKRFK